MDPTNEFAAEWITRGARALAAGIGERQAARGLATLAAIRHDDAFADLVGDTELRLLHLAEAVATARDGLFLDHVAGAKIAMTARRRPIHELDLNLDCAAEELRERLPVDGGNRAASCLAAARRHLAAAPDRVESLLAADAPHVGLARRYLLAVLEGRAEDAVALLIDAHAGGLSAPDLHRHVLSRVQHELGRMWLMNEIHVAEEHLVSRITLRAMHALAEREPRAASNGRRVLCSTVPGDLHELGLRAVADHLRFAGFDVLDLGSSTPAPDLLLGVVDFEPDVVVLSASLVLHVRAAARVIAFLRERLETPPPVLAGGRPFTLVPDLWQVVGADATAPTAADAVVSAVALGSRRRPR